jgi:hypothetical protein
MRQKAEAKLGNLRLNINDIIKISENDLLLYALDLN